MAALQWARATNLQRSSSQCRDSTSGASGSQTGPAGCSVTHCSSWSFCGSNGTQMWCGGHWPRVPGLCPHGERGQMPCSMGTANLAHTRCASIPPVPLHVHPHSTMLWRHPILWGCCPSSDEQSGNPGHMVERFSTQKNNVWAKNDGLFTKTHSSPAFTSPALCSV